jgi:hypothetical protein
MDFRSLMCDVALSELLAAQRSSAQPAACLHVPAKLTPEAAEHEARKRRANERHAVGCCGELACPAASADDRQRHSVVNA